MSSAYGDIPSNAPGPIILCAQVYALAGQADLVQSLLSDIQRHSLSDKEPGCLEYRVVRSYAVDSAGVNKFTIFEQYRDASAITAHFETVPFQTLVAKIGKEKILTQPPIIEYFYELKA